MVKGYLHIGMHKTGTSAIQTFMYGLRRKLLEKYKILYPETGVLIVGGTPGHHYMGFSLIKSINVEQFIPPKSFEEYINDLKVEILKTNPEIVIISSEVFDNIQDSHSFNRLKKGLNDIFNDMSIIVYFRRQDLLIESFYSQAIKHWSVKEKADFKTFVNRHKVQSNLLNYDIFLERWNKSFPEAKIIPRIYDRKKFTEGNVMIDFFSSLGIDLPEIKEMQIEVNPSLTPLSSLVMRKINQNFDLSRNEHWKVFKYLLQLDKEEGSPIKTFFTLPERIEFLEHFKESNERLFSEWFNGKNEFVLPKLLVFNLFRDTEKALLLP